MSAVVTETDKTFIRGLRSAVKQRGEDFVYPDQWRTLWPERSGIDSPNSVHAYGACQYSINGKGACIIGLAVLKATGEPYEGPNQSASVLLTGTYGVSEIVATAMNHAQGAQDRGATWGEALVQFERHLALNNIVVD